MSILEMVKPMSAADKRIVERALMDETIMELLRQMDGLESLQRESLLNAVQTPTKRSLLITLGNLTSQDLAKTGFKN